MAIQQIVQDGKLVDTSAEGSSQSSKNEKPGNQLDKDAFLQLLVAQMQYQDPLEPTDNTEYISQLATFSQLEGTQNLQQSMKAMEANDLVGKQVILKVTSSVTGATNFVTGKVDYVLHENGETYLSVNDKLYSIDDLDTVADQEYMDAISVVKAFTTAVAKMPNANQITLADEEKLTNLRKTYEEMTDYQKTFVDKDTIAALEKLEDKMAELKEIAGEEPEEPEEPGEPGDGEAEKPGDGDNTEETGKTS